MSLNFAIKLGLFNRKFDIERLVSGNMDFGVYEHAFCLNTGVIGSPTIIFGKDKIGRGVEVRVEGGKLNFDSPVPSTNSDVELLFELLQRAIELTGAKQLIFNERTVECKLLGQLKDGIKKIHQEGLSFLEENSNDKNQILVYGAKQVVVIGRKEVEKIVQDWSEYEEYLHKAQRQDVLFDEPMFLQKEEGILCVYMLTKGIKTSLPKHKNFLLDTDEVDISKWYVGFYDLEKDDILGIIPYDVFLENVDTTDMLDAERFIVELSLDEMKALLDKYSEPM